MLLSEKVIKLIRVSIAFNAIVGQLELYAKSIHSSALSIIYHSSMKERHLLTVYLVRLIKI